MLNHLYIKNFVLIDELNLDLTEGFNVFIGETGAGKSIFIDAISLLCAERSSSGLVGKASDKAIIEGSFSLENDTHAKQLLEDNGFECNDSTTFTREILANGKSVARIDHRIVSLSLLKDVLLNQVDIHGQRETQYLLNKHTHIHLLDEYLGLKEEVKQLKDSYQVYSSLVKEKETVLNDTFNETDLEYFQYQVQEIEDADLKEGEEEELLEKEKQFEAVKDSYDKITQSINTYNDLDSSLYELNKLIQSLPSTNLFNTIKEQFSNHYYEMSDSIESLKKEYDSFEFTDEDINSIEERLYLIQKLKRKYGKSIEEIQNLKEDLLKKIEMMNHRNEYLEEMDKKISKAYEIYIDHAKKVSNKRNKGSKKLDEAVMKHLKDLSLPNAKFKTMIHDTSESPNGIDDVEFYISMNLGEELAPLIKTASGGELSRLMLGLKVIFTHLQGIETVIFDEIDTGVSGNVASLIGLKMKELSKDTQVLTVTHLAPVAAYADHHYLVTKSSSKNSTSTNVLSLDEKETIEQLALLSSGEVTDVSVAAAKELYDRSHS